jgi:hypothetical protein
VSTHQRMVGLHVCAVDSARTKCSFAHIDSGAVRIARRVSHRRNLWLHGRIDRRVKQSDLRRRHSVDRDVCINTNPRGISNCGHKSGAGRLCTFHNVDRLRVRDDLNDNLQDLKTGQLVGASPMRQQIALIVGVAAGAAVIPFVLNLLATAYGFAGAANVGVVAPNPLPAPQATLISALAQGVIGGNLEWKMIGIGALVGVGLILLDTILGAMKKMRIPPLAVGIGIYLPMSATFAVVVGAVLSYWYGRRIRTSPDPGRAERLGTLVASGLIVGESLWGVINAGLIVGLSNDAPIGLLPENFAPAPWLGLLGFVGVIVMLYSWMLGRARARG